MITPFAALGSRCVPSGIASIAASCSSGRVAGCGIRVIIGCAGLVIIVISRLVITLIGRFTSCLITFSCVALVRVVIPGIRTSRFFGPGSCISIRIGIVTGLICLI